MRLATCSHCTLPALACSPRVPQRPRAGLSHRRACRSRHGPTGARGQRQLVDRGSRLLAPRRPAPGLGLVAAWAGGQAGAEDRGGGPAWPHCGLTRSPLPSSAVQCTPTCEGTCPRRLGVWRSRPRSPGASVPVLGSLCLVGGEAPTSLSAAVSWVPAAGSKQRWRESRAVSSSSLQVEKSRRRYKMCRRPLRKWGQGQNQAHRPAPGHRLFLPVYASQTVPGFQIMPGNQQLSQSPTR